MNLAETLSARARSRPDAAAIIEERRGAMTFAELDRRSGKIASLLRRSGVRAADPILILHPISAELYALLIGVFKIGAVAMFLDPSAGREHIDRCCELQAPAALAASPKAHLLRLSSRALRRIPLMFSTGGWSPGARSLSAANEEPVLADFARCEEDTPALLTFTSGSTGLPKAAVRTHGFLLAQHRVLERHIDLREGEVDLVTLPIFMLANLASGVTSVIPDADLRSPGLVKPEPILAQIARHQVTRCSGSPAFFERLLDGGDVSCAPLAGMRKLFTGGAPVFPRLIERLASAAPRAKVEAVYGSTEAEPIAHLDAGEITSEDRLMMRQGGGLLAGRPIPEIRLRVIRDQWGRAIGPFSGSEFERQQVPAGQPGEIVVSGAHVLKSYLHGRGDEETKFAVENETWHRTGDAGRLDPSGRLWLLGRCAARAGDLYPFAIECVAMENEAIRRAAFILQHEKRILAIETAPGSGKGIVAELNETLVWARIEEIRIFDRLPVDRRHNAKIDYPALRRLLD